MTGTLGRFTQNYAAASCSQIGQEAETAPTCVRGGTREHYQTSLGAFPKLPLPDLRPSTPDYALTRSGNSAGLDAPKLEFPLLNQHVIFRFKFRG